MLVVNLLLKISFFSLTALICNKLVNFLDLDKLFEILIYFQPLIIYKQSTVYPSTLFFNILTF